MNSSRLRRREMLYQIPNGKKSPLRIGLVSDASLAERSKTQTARCGALQAPCLSRLRQRGAARPRKRPGMHSSTPARNPWETYTPRRVPNHNVGRTQSSNASVCFPLVSRHLLCPSNFNAQEQEKQNSDRLRRLPLALCAPFPILTVYFRPAWQ